MATERKLIMDAVEMTKGIPATDEEVLSEFDKTKGNDVLVPLQQPEDENLVPLPEIEYKIVEANTMDKLVRDVNSHLKNGRQTEGGVQVVNGNLTRFYQSMVRWVVKPESNLVAKPEMPSQNSEAEYLGPQAVPLEEETLD